MRKLALVALLFSGCVPLMNLAMDRGIHQEHLDAWSGQPVAKLERHPLWGVPTRKETLSDGTVAYVYVNEGPTETTVRQNAVNGQIYGGTTWTPRCTNTFLVKDGVVQRYSLKGNCYTDTTLLPDYHG